ncbi:MAG: putative decarboxylase [uncultured bacterium]|nr:MAG: putative decarboxylase [uncultured bacterium]
MLAQPIVIDGKTVREKTIIMKKYLAILGACLVAACGTIGITSTKEGLVEYAGAQKDIFSKGKAERVMSLESLAGRPGLYGVGPVEGLDGEITVIDGKPYVSKVRESGNVLEQSHHHGAFFFVWAEQAQWRDIPIPEGVKGYVDLQNFVKAQAGAVGIDTSKPFPFRLSGTPTEIKWHINVDRTEGKTVTNELFVKSKEPYVTNNEPVDIIGFYSEHHGGVFISDSAPAIKRDSGLKNAIHIHFVSRASKMTGHIDNITLGSSMVLHLPKP